MTARALGAVRLLAGIGVVVSSTQAPLLVGRARIDRAMGGSLSLEVLGILHVPVAGVPCGAVQDSLEAGVSFSSDSVALLSWVDERWLS